METPNVVVKFLWMVFKWGNPNAGIGAFELSSLNRACKRKGKEWFKICLKLYIIKVDLYQHPQPTLYLFVPIYLLNIKPFIHVEAMLYYYFTFLIYWFTPSFIHSENTHWVSTTSRHYTIRWVGENSYSDQTELKWHISGPEVVTAGTRPSTAPPQLGILRKLHVPCGSVTTWGRVSASLPERGPREPLWARSMSEKQPCIWWIHRILRFIFYCIIT